MPEDFADRLSRLLKQFTNATTAGYASSASCNFQMPQQDGQSIAASSTVPIRSVDSDFAQDGFHKGRQIALSQVTSLTLSTPLSARLRVLLVVKQGTDYRLAQIPVSDITSLEFFKRLRSEYFRMRGIWRRCFSVWRYSHCDFYKVSQICNADYEMEAHLRSVRKVRRPRLRASAEGPISGHLQYRLHVLP